MRLEIVTKRDSLFFIGVITILASLAALWMPVDWSVEKKMISGAAGGSFWGVIAMTSRLIGAFEEDE